MVRIRPMKNSKGELRIIFHLPIVYNFYWVFIVYPSPLLSLSLSKRKHPHFNYNTGNYYPGKLVLLFFSLILYKLSLRIVKTVALGHTVNTYQNQKLNYRTIRIQSLWSFYGTMWLPQSKQHFMLRITLIFILFHFIYLLTYREREEGRERNVDLLFHYLCIHWLILICALTRELNSTPWHIEMTL